MDAGHRRCFRHGGQIYHGDVVEEADGRCIRQGLGLQIFTAQTVTGEPVIWGRYNGGWKADKMTGTGAYRWSNGTHYDGGFFDGKPHGHGKLVWPEGSFYDGHWSHGELHGEGSFYSAYEGFAVHGKFVRNCLQQPDGSWVELLQRRERHRAERLRIRPPPLPPSAIVAGGAVAAEASAEIPVTVCSPTEVFEVAVEALRSPLFRVPLILADASCPDVGGAQSSAAPLWCLEATEGGCSPSTTVYVSHAAAEKRRRRGYADLFRNAICEALLTHRPFCLVFGNEDERGGNPQEAGGALPADVSLDEFLDPTSLPPDLFDLQNLHTTGAADQFLPMEKRGALGRVAKGAAAEGEESSALPAAAPPGLLYLLRVAMVSLRRVPCGLEQEQIRAHIVRRFGRHVPLHRVAVIVVSSE